MRLHPENQKGPAGSEGAYRKLDRLFNANAEVWNIRIGSTQESPMYNILVRFIKDESGATAIEYGLIAAGISVAIIAVVKGTGTNLKTTFGSVQTALK
jgi:pilus assembly protein Flp/PilA